MSLFILRRALTMLGLALWLVACAGASAGTTPRPADWARPVASEHLKNFYQVDAHLYRSAQPDAAGMAELYAQGIRQVVSLRQFHTDEDEARGVGLALHRIPMNAGEIHDAQVIAALRAIRDADGPVLLHCWHGSDRTGTVVALYRMLFQGWERQAAIDEMVNGGYGYHALYANIVRYLQQVDLEALSRSLASAPTSASPAAAAGGAVPAIPAP